jgi:isoleucyl-tRNA synthetase
LIDVKIENAVSRMQVVIELGRVLRDRRTLPIKVRSFFSYSVAAGY